MNFPYTPKMDQQLAFRVRQSNLTDERRLNLQKKLPFITISRQFGCPAYPLSDLLKQRLNVGLDPKEGWAVLDRELIKEIASQHNLSEDLVRSLKEDVRSQLNQYLDKLFANVPTEFTIYKKMVETLRYLAEKGNVIIVGFGGAILTRHIDRGFHVRLVGSFESRMQYVKKCTGFSETEAAKFVREKEVERDSFIKRFTRESADDPLHYHLVLNVDKSSLEDMVETVLFLFKNILGRESYSRLKASSVE
jgi:cytidylate kinase